MQLLFFSLGLPGISLCCSLRYQKQIKVYFSALKLSPLLKTIYKKDKDHLKCSYFVLICRCSQLPQLFVSRMNLEPLLTPLDGL